MHYTIYFDMVKICYRVSDCALCHSDIEMICWFGGFCLCQPLSFCAYGVHKCFTQDTFYSFINTQFYSRVCSKGPCKWGLRPQKIGLAAKKDTYCCLCDRGDTRTPRLIKSGSLPHRSARGYSGLHHSVMTPFPFSPNKR